MTTDKIEEKIRKLLQLAGNNPSVEEAALAFAKAQDLATAHGLELDDVMRRAAEDATPPPRREVEGIVREWIDRWDRVVPWRMTIASAVLLANNCQPRYQSGNAGGVLGLGQPSDLATARYVYLAIVREVERLAVAAVDAYKNDPEVDPRWDASPRVYGRSWRTGCADAIALRMPTPSRVIDAKRLEAQKARALALGMGDVSDDGRAGGSTDQNALATATNALVRVDQAAEFVTAVQAAIEAWKKEHGYKNSGGRHFGESSRSGSGYANGRAAGQRVSLGGSGRALKGGA